MAKGGEQYHESTGSDRLPVRTLADDGITKTQSSKWQKLAALPEQKFEIRVEHAKARVKLTKLTGNVAAAVSAQVRHLVAEGLVDGRRD
jgi:hypothetical protein